MRLIANLLMRFFVFCVLTIWSLTLGVGWANDDKSYSSLIHKIISLSEQQKLSQHSYWHILLHSKNQKSKIKDPSFFLYKPKPDEPKWSLNLELQHNIKGFFLQEELQDRHPICLFPARFNWITTQLKIDRGKFPQPKCLQFEQYVKNVLPQKVEIKFVSEDVNNVTTMLGHIYFDFVRENINKEEIRHAVSYITPTNGKPSLQIVYEAFVGGDGFLTLQPSEQVLHNYLYNEQRNVWTYPLRLSKKQMYRLALHTWELKDINAGYYFIQHNCGTIFFDLLSSAIPSLAQNTLKPWITPLEYIQYINDLGHIQTPEIRVELSPQYAIRAVASDLTDEQKDIARQLTMNTSDTVILNSFSIEEKFKILFLAKQILLNNVVNNNKLALPHTVKNLNAISTLLDDNNEVTVSNTKHPINSARSSRFRISYFAEERALHNNAKFLLGFMPVNSYLTDDHSQYFNEYSLKLSDFSLVYDQQNKDIELYEWNIYQFKSLTPSNQFHAPLVMELRLGAQQEYDQKLASYLGFGGQFGLGYAVNLYKDDLLAYAQFSLKTHYGNAPNVNERLYWNVIPEVGMMMKQIFAMKSLLIGQYIIDYENDFSYFNIDFTQSLFLSNQYTALLFFNSKTSSSHYSEKIGLELVYKF